MHNGKYFSFIAFFITVLIWKTIQVYNPMLSSILKHCKYKQIWSKQTFNMIIISSEKCDQYQDTGKWRQTIKVEILN
jgi:hypothetical protein